MEPIRLALRMRDTIIAVCPLPPQPSVTRISMAMACVRRGLISASSDNVMDSVTMSTARRPIVQHSVSGQDTVVTEETV